MSGKLIIEVEDLLPWLDENSALIITGNTGVYYSAQVGGTDCYHPEVEGFFYKIPDLSEFDDCKYGCCRIPQIPELQEKLSKDLDAFLIEKSLDWRLKFRFDFDRKNDLMEGWWPVVVTGMLSDWHKTVGEWKGFIYTGNCD